MIIDDKVIMPPSLPPPYLQSTSSPTPSSHSHHQSVPNLAFLPSHILLQIIHRTFPPIPTSALSNSSKLPQFSQIEYQLSQPTVPERQRKTLFWLSTHLRRVSRAFYTTCMHVLRSTYLPAYLALIRPPYTSDPFPVGLPASGAAAGSAVVTQSNGGGPPAYSAPPSPPLSPAPNPLPTPFSMIGSSASSIRSVSSVSTTNPSSLLITQHRETTVLDRFIILKVRQDVFLDDSEFHTERVDKFRDLFEIAQPKARLEDLVRIFGVSEGVISIHGGVEGRQSREGRRDSRVVESEGQDREVEGRSSTESRSWAKGSLYNSHSPHSSSAHLADPGPSASSKSDAITTSHHNSRPISPRNKPPKTKSRLSLFFPFKSKKSPPPSPLSSPASPTPVIDHPISSTTKKRPEVKPLPFSSLSVTFSPRRVGLLHNRTRTIVQVNRTPGHNTESLETLAKNLVRELKNVLERPA